MSERQKHGFIFETYIINRYNLIKENRYTSHFDVYTQKNIPIQIKCIKRKNEICFGDFYRNMSNQHDFILIVGFYDQDSHNINNIDILYIDNIRWKQLFDFKEYHTLLEEFKLITNLKIVDSRFRSLRNKYSRIFKSQFISLRIKRDHKTQKRIQCAISYKNFLKMKKYFKPILLEMSDSRLYEKFYTKPEVSKKCIILMNEFIRTDTKDPSIYSYIEPSAGNGSFSDILIDMKMNCTSYDIKPEKDYMKQEDFLKLETI